MPAFDTPAPEFYWTCLQWLVIAIVWGVLAWGTYREDRRIKGLQGSPIPPSEMAALLQMLHQRHVQIGILVTLLLVAEAAGDLRHGAESLSPAAPPMATTAPQATIIPDSKTSAPELSHSGIVATLPPSLGLPFSDITEFNEQNSKQQAYLDWLKQRYEAWLVTYYYLKKCGQTGPQDLSLIQESLQKELADAHADAMMRDNILLAATGSYKEMYGDIPCDSGRIAETRSAYDAAMQKLGHPPATPEAKPAPESGAPANP